MVLKGQILKQSSPEVHSTTTTLANQGSIIDNWNIENNKWKRETVFDNPLSNLSWIDMIMCMYILCLYLSSDPLFFFLIFFFFSPGDWCQRVCLLQWFSMKDNYSFQYGTFDNLRDTVNHPIMHKTFPKTNTLVNLYLVLFLSSEMSSIHGLMGFISLSGYYDFVEHTDLSIFPCLHVK